MITERLYANETGELWDPDGLVLTTAASPQGGVGTEAPWPLVQHSWPLEHVLEAFELTVEAWPPVPVGEEIVSRETAPGSPVQFLQVTQPIPAPPTGEMLVRAIESRGSAEREALKRQRMVSAVVTELGGRVDEAGAQVRIDALTAAQRTRLEAAIAR